MADDRIEEKKYEFEYSYNNYIQNNSSRTVFGTKIWRFRK